MTYEFDNFGKLVMPTAAQLEQADEDVSIIVLDQGLLEDDRPYWAYIAVKPSMYAEFIYNTSQQIEVDLEDYGEIIKMGYEEEVPAWAMEEMRSQYNFDDQYVEKLGQKILVVQTSFLQQRELKRIYAIVAMLKKRATEQQQMQQQQKLQGGKPQPQQKLPGKQQAKKKAK